MIQKKICILGAAGVGKTSLVGQFVYSKFSEKYLSTMGVKIDRKEVMAKGIPVKLMLWDIHGEEKHKKITTSYLRGAAGVILVVDGTRAETLHIAEDILQRVREDVGEIPYLFLFNKADLKDCWCMTDVMLEQSEKLQVPMYQTSAKTGENVEQAFVSLAEMLLDS